MQYKNGKSRLTHYKNIDITLDFPRSRVFDKLQFTFGGMVESEVDDYKRQFSLVKYQLKQLLYRRSKDGYYQPNFIFIPKIGENYKETGKGLVYFEIFIHLEEPYERNFIVEHLKTIFQEVDDLLGDNQYFNFHKYNPKRYSKVAED